MTPKIIQTYLSWNLSMPTFVGEKNHCEGMTILNALYRVFGAIRNGGSYGWLMTICWWGTFILWEISDQFSHLILATNINTNIVPCIIFYHHVQKKVAHSILFKTVDHLSQQTQTLSRAYPARLITSSLPNLESCSFLRALYLCDWSLEQFILSYSFLASCWPIPKMLN